MSVAIAPLPRDPVERAILTMHRSLDQSLSLNDLAAEVGLSPFHFHRLFRAATGIPPNQFLTCLRMAEAERLLLTTPASVTDICWEVGYAALGTFLTRFTQLVGLSPRRLRQFADTATLPSLERLRGALAFEGAPYGRRPSIAGVVRSAPPVPGVTFAGLFPQPIPQARCVRSTVLPTPGAFWITPPPDGAYHLLVACLPWAEDPRVPLLSGRRLRVGAWPEPIAADHPLGRPLDIVLRPPRLTDPPILTCLPYHLMQRLDPPAALA